MKEYLVLTEDFYYLQKSDFVYECKLSSFGSTNKKISIWKSTGIFNYISNTNMIAVKNASGELPDIKAMMMYMFI